MKKWLVYSVLAVCSFIRLHAEVEKMEYAALGTLRDYPTVGVGVRYFSGYHGIDLSGNALSIGRSFPVANARALYLFYPQKTHLYCGLGCSALYERRELPEGNLGMDGVVGYQASKTGKTRWFLQTEAICPLTNHVTSLWPAVRFGFGF